MGGENQPLTASALVLFLVEHCSSSSRRLRNPLVDTALAPLLTDAREVLLDDANGISKMSYLTSGDRKGLGKLVLTTIDIRGTAVFGVTKKAGY